MMKTMLAAALLTAAANVAGAETIDFEGLTPEVDGILEVGPFYSEDGFNLTVDGGTLESVGSEFPYYAGSTSLSNGMIGGSVMLTRSGGGTFGLHSIDLAELLVGFGPVSVLFDAVLADGGSTSQVFTLDRVEGFQTLTFADAFDNVSSVSWMQAWAPHQFDNLVVSANASVEPPPAPVPLPASMPLLLAALGGLALHRRRKAA